MLVQPCRGCSEPRFWDGDAPPERVERCLVRAMWSGHQGVDMGGLSLDGFHRGPMLVQITTRVPSQISPS